jgi:hypothetical protein
LRHCAATKLSATPEQALLKRQLPAAGEVKNHVPVSGPLDVLELLEPRLFTYSVNAYAEAGSGSFGDEPGLTLPFE